MTDPLLVLVEDYLNSKFKRLNPRKRKKGKIVPAKGKTAWGRIYEDGREVCDLKRDAGRAEYYRRKYAMWKRQGWNCCLCGHIMTAFDMTFEHQNGRGGGKRDDRIELNGKPYNGAAHLWCNSKKGSKRLSKGE